MGHGVRTLIGAVLCLGLAGQAAAQTADLRTCALDHVSFVHSLDGRVFEVDEVGRLSITVCGGSTTFVRADMVADRSDCARPHSYTILEGRYSEADGEHLANVWAIWNVLPAAPCCDWTFDMSEFGFGRISSYGDENAGQSQVFDMIDWLDGANVPSIADLGAPLMIPLRQRPFESDGVLVPAICAAG